jgi:hypothetical protein
MIAGVVQGFVVWHEIDLEPSKATISFQVTWESVAVAGHGMIGDDEFLGPRAWDVPALQYCAVQRREENIFICHAILVWSTEDWATLAGFEKLRVRLDEIRDRFSRRGWMVRGR